MRIQDVQFSSTSNHPDIHEVTIKAMLTSEEWRTSGLLHGAATSEQYELRVACNDSGEQKEKTNHFMGVDICNTEPINKYKFKAPAEQCIDYHRIQQDLSMSKPLAIVEYDGLYHFVLHHAFIEKARQLKVNLLTEPSDDPLEIGYLVDLVRKVAQAPWPNKVTNDIVKVTLIEA